MAIGAYAAIGAARAGMNLLVAFVLAGAIAALVGVLFGLPSLRIKGFYLAVATLAAQFFIDWLFIRIKWFTNYATNATAPELVFFGIPLDSAMRRYLFTLTIVAVMALVAKNLVRGATGRAWMAVRDMDIAAEIIGIRLLRTKLLAFAVSSFYCGLRARCRPLCIWALGTADLRCQSFFPDMFMVIIGGVGSILGSFLGAAFIFAVPI
jgi:branched-chain amino acid transport system permease protein